MAKPPAIPLEKLDIKAVLAVMRTCIVAVIFLGDNDLALVEGGACIGSGTSVLWVGDEQAQGDYPLLDVLPVEVAVAAVKKIRDGFVSELSKEQRQLVESDVELAEEN